MLNKKPVSLFGKSCPYDYGPHHHCAFRVCFASKRAGCQKLNTHRTVPSRGRTAQSCARTLSLLLMAASGPITSRSHCFAPQVCRELRGLRSTAASSRAVIDIAKTNAHSVGFGSRKTAHPSSAVLVGPGSTRKIRPWMGRSAPAG